MVAVVGFACSRWPAAAGRGPAAGEGLGAAAGRARSERAETLGSGQKRDAAPVVRHRRGRPGRRACSSAAPTGSTGCSPPSGSSPATPRTSCAPRSRPCRCGWRRSCRPTTRRPCARRPQRAGPGRAAGHRRRAPARQRRATATCRAGPVPLDDVVLQQVVEWEPAFAAGRRIVRATGTRGLVALATPNGLSQVLATLLENSLVHGAGTVTVSTRSTGISLVVEVTDEGPGVPPELGSTDLRAVGERPARHRTRPGGGPRAGRGRRRPARAGAAEAGGVRAVPQRRAARLASTPDRCCGLVGTRGEHPPAVGPEPERRAERQADDVGRDVVGQRAGEVEHVVRDRQAGQRDQPGRRR